MKNLLLFIIVTSGFVSFATAQKHEIGLSLGRANIIGDIGKTDYIEIFPENKNLPISLGILYRFNLNNRQSLRFNLVYNKVNFDNSEASEDYRYNHWAYGENTIIETAALFEYSFFDINDIKRRGSSPYIFAGLAGYASNDRNYTISHNLYKNSDGSDRLPNNSGDFKTTSSYDKSTRFDFSIPFGVGYKFKFNYNWVLGIEVGARYTFQDNLDYSALKTDKFTVDTNPVLNDPVYQSEIEKRNSEIIGRNQKGNTYKNNDWYMVWGVNFTYTFGRPPCYCY